jgi:hypothetical protein
MFTWSNKQGVRSDEGFEFQFTGRFTAEYRENGRVTDMYVEDGVGWIIIYEGSIESLWNNKDNPFERKFERNRIVKNLQDALAFQGLRLNLVPGPEPDYEPPHKNVER